jgi:hypothetical protein
MRHFFNKSRYAQQSILLLVGSLRLLSAPFSFLFPRPAIRSSSKNGFNLHRLFSFPFYVFALLSGALKIKLSGT